MPLMPGLGKQRQEELFEFKASVNYIVHSRIGGGWLHSETMSQNKAKVI